PAILTTRDRAGGGSRRIDKQSSLLARSAVRRRRNNGFIPCRIPYRLAAPLLATGLGYVVATPGLWPPCSRARPPPEPRSSSYLEWRPAYGPSGHHGRRAGERPCPARRRHERVRPADIRAGVQHLPE